MKKLIIVVLVTVLLLVGAIWGYLFLFGAPESPQDFFADLGLGGEERVFEQEEEAGFPEDETDSGTEINSALRALSARSVVDFVVLGTSTNDGLVRIVEQGTGQIYDISLATGQETTVSSATNQGINQAQISPDGEWVVLLAVRSNNPTASLVSLASTNTPTRDLPSDIKEVGFSSDSKSLYYIRTDTKGSLAYSYDLAGGNSKVLFSIPFIAPAILWGNETIVYNRPGENYQGYAYTVGDDKELVRLTNGGVGLTVTQLDETVFVNRLNEQGIYTGYLVQPGKPDIEVGKALMPEKCASGSTNTLVYCAISRVAHNAQMPFSWYKGETLIKDQLWAINIASSSSKVIGEISNDAREFDVIKLGVSTDLTTLVFIDKNSNTVWAFDTTKASGN